MTGLPPAAPAARKEPPDNDIKSRGGGRSALRGRAGFKKRGRKASGGVGKKQSTGSRSSGSSFTTKPATRGGKGGGRGSGTRAIGMMPM